MLVSIRLLCYTFFLYFSSFIYFRMVFTWACVTCRAFENIRKWLIITLIKRLGILLCLAPYICIVYSIIVYSLQIFESNSYSWFVSCEHFIFLFILMWYLKINDEYNRNIMCLYKFFMLHLLSHTIFIVSSVAYITFWFFVHTYVLKMNSLTAFYRMSWNK